MEAIIKRKSLYPVVNTLYENHITNHFDRINKSFTAVGSNLPLVNIKENQSEFEVELAAPGLKKEDFKVEVDHKILKIATVLNEKSEVNNLKKDYIKKEFNYHSFYRSFYLPDSADIDKITAVYKDGILDVKVAKKEKAPLTIAKKIVIQ